MIKPIYYECGICTAWHPWEWNGDCREDAARFFADELDTKYGITGWEERDMQDRLEADLRGEP